MYQKELVMHGVFAPMTWYPSDAFSPAFNLQGIAILTPHAISNTKSSCYAGDPESIPTFKSHDATSYNHMLLVADITKDGQTYTIGTTHFTWTPNGEADDMQRKNLMALMRILDRILEFVLCGDFSKQARILVVILRLDSG